MLHKIWTQPLSRLALFGMSVVFKYSVKSTQCWILKLKVIHVYTKEFKEHFPHPPIKPKRKISFSIQVSFLKQGILYRISQELYGDLYTSQPHLSRFNVPRFYTESCRSNARVPGGSICSSVLDISFHRIKALAAIASPSSAERLRTNPRDVIGGGEGREGGEGRQTDRGERKGGIWRGGWFKG